MKLRKLIRNSYRYWTRFWFPRTIESEQPVLDGYACNPTVSTPLESSISPLNRVRRLVSVRFNPRRYGKHTNAIVRARIFFSADFEFPRIWYRDLVVGIRRQSLTGRGEGESLFARHSRLFRPASEEKFRARPYDKSLDCSKTILGRRSCSPGKLYQRVSLHPSSRWFARRFWK